MIICKTAIFGWINYKFYGVSMNEFTLTSRYFSVVYYQPNNAAGDVVFTRLLNEYLEVEDPPNYYSQALVCVQSCTSKMNRYHLYLRYTYCVWIHHAKASCAYCSI